ncbi:T200A protein, partial [Urocolius indicus]|nr:T200A protein [Urocolius indicus]
MTAKSPEANGPLRDAEGGPPKAPVPPVPSRRRGRRLRRKTPAEGQPRGRLRMRSPSGAFVVLGVSVVLVGMTIAVVGYWPHRGAGAAGAGAGNGSGTGDVRRDVAAGRQVPHGEKLKLIGPVIMGIGLFIFICANTMLYENRDMETRRLMQKGLDALAAAGPEGTDPEDGRPVPGAAVECVEGCYQVDLSHQPCPNPGSKWSDCYGPNRLQATAAAPATASLLSLPCRAGAEALLSSAVGALALPVIKLNNCLLDTAARGAADRAEGVPTEPSREALRLCHGQGHVVVDVDGGGCPGTEPAPEPHAPGHSKSLDLGRPGVLLLAPIKERKNRSWPRLDHVSLVAYSKLQRTGESSDRL